MVDEFHHVVKGTRVDLLDITKSRNILENSVKKVILDVCFQQSIYFLFKISNFLTKYKTQNEKSKFYERISTFIDRAKEDLGVLDRVCLFAFYVGYTQVISAFYISSGNTCKTNGPYCRSTCVSISKNTRWKNYLMT